jgi:YD repeat-containing protein
LVTAAAPVSLESGCQTQVATKTDAKGQQIVYTYDSLSRLTKVQRYAGGVEDTCQQENYSYDSNPYDSNYSQNVIGRLAAKQYFGGVPGTVGGNNTNCATTFTEMYSYSPGGLALKKKLRVTRTLPVNNLNPPPAPPLPGQAVNADLEAVYTVSVRGTHLEPMPEISDDGGMGKETERSARVREHPGQQRWPED